MYFILVFSINMLVPTLSPKVGVRRDAPKKRAVGRSPIPGLICSYLPAEKKGHQVLCTSRRVQENGCQCGNGKECTGPTGVPHVLRAGSWKEKGSITGAVLNLTFLLSTLASI